MDDSAPADRYPGGRIARFQTTVRTNADFLVISLLTVYLLFNTGFVSDDFVDILQMKDQTFPQLLMPTGNFVNVPVAHFTHHIWFALFGMDTPLIVDFFKMGFTIVSIFWIRQFFLIFVSQRNALWVSFAFVFFPSHDAIPYWYAPTAHLVSMALYMYSFSLAYRDRLAPAFLLGLVASFMVYGSTPIALSLSLLFLLYRDFKKSLIMLIPNLLYIIYFVTITMIVSVAPSRVLEPVSAPRLLKQFILQIATFTDATLGPSMWLKVGYAFPQLSWSSWLIGVVLLCALSTSSRDDDDRYNPRLLLALCALALSSFAMFAVTGRYPQLAFNLGNRATFWGSLLLAYVLVLMPKGRWVKVGVYGIFLFTVLGIADHWGILNTHQRRVIKAVGLNEDLRNLPNGSHVFVSGNQYSHYGPISHIEFLSEDWVPRSIFGLKLKHSVYAQTLSQLLHYEDGYLYNSKNSDVTVVGANILVYDSDRDRLLSLAAKDINPYIGKLPKENRHWLMLDNRGPLKLIKKAAVYLMPRLEGSLQ